MIIMKRFCFAFILFAFSPLGSNAAGPDDWAESIRTMVWAWDIPGFHNRTVPEGYEKESAVILARHRRIEATGDKSTFMKELLTGSRAGKIYYIDIERSLVRINDQAALDYFSEHSFRDKENRGFGMYSNLLRTVLGVRIIKPDSTIREVDVSALAVSITEGKNNKEAYKKLAIPELQVGDMIDIFVYEIAEFTTMNISPQTIGFYSPEYPCLSFSLHCEFGKNLTIEYRSVNGAPDMEAHTAADGKMTLDAAMDNVACIKGAPQWVSYMRSMPMVRLSVLQNASKAFYKPSSARPIGIHKDVPSDQILEDARGYYNFGLRHISTSGGFMKNVNAAIAGYRQKTPDATTVQLADYIYAALNFYFPRNSFYNRAAFSFLLSHLFQENGIRPFIGFVTSRYDARLAETANDEDFYSGVAIDEGARFYFGPYRYSLAGEVPGALQGETAFLFPIQKFTSSPGVSGVEFSQHGFQHVIPVQEPAENLNATKMKVTFSGEDRLSLIIDRESTWTGTGDKHTMQNMLISYEPWDSVVRRELLIGQSYIDEISKQRSLRKEVGSVQTYFEKEREKAKERFGEEIYTYHEVRQEQIISCSINGYGASPANPALVYNIKYSIDSFVKNAGDNLVLDAGKLIGTQWVPTATDRDRIMDAYMPEAKQFDYQIEVVIPDNYCVEGVERLNYDFSNEYGAFSSNATVNGQVLSISVKKIYSRPFVPLEDWGKILEMVDTANDFYSVSVVLKRV